MLINLKRIGGTARLSRENYRSRQKSSMIRQIRSDLKSDLSKQTFPFMIEEKDNEKLSPEFKLQLNNTINMVHFLVDTLIELGYKNTARSVHQKLSSPVARLNKLFVSGDGKVHKVTAERALAFKK